MNIMKHNITFTRRTFIKGSALVTTGIATGSLAYSSPITPTANSDSIYLVGPQEGYSPRIGTLLSTMTMMRTWVVREVQNLTKEQLDFQIDEQSNSIGAMLLHLAATERYYQLNTFDEMPWGSWDDGIKKEWDVAMSLGDTGRSIIKGYEIDFYLNKLEEVRSITKEEFAKRDDDWLDKSERFFDNLPTNNHGKWFHVCEHESNHNGQIKFIKKRFES